MESWVENIPKQQYRKSWSAQRIKFKNKQNAVQDTRTVRCKKGSQGLKLFKVIVWNEPVCMLDNRTKEYCVKVRI